MDNLGWYLIPYSLNSMAYFSILPDKSDLCKYFWGTSWWARLLDGPENRDGVSEWRFSRLRLFAPYLSIRFLHRPLLWWCSRWTFALCLICSETKQCWPPSWKLLSTCITAHRAEGCSGWAVVWDNARSLQMQIDSLPSILSHRLLSAKGRRALVFP